MPGLQHVELQHVERVDTNVSDKIEWRDKVWRAVVKHIHVVCAV